MSVKLLVAIILVSVCLTSNAQDSNPDRGSLYFVNGFQFINPVNLNSAASGAGFPFFSSSFVTGFGGRGEFRKMIFGGEGFYLSHTMQQNGNTTQCHGGMGYFYVGYKIINTSRWKMFPVVGIGLGGTTYTFTEAVANTSSLPAILGGQHNAATFDNGSAILHTGLSGEYKYHNRYYIGLKGGYNVSLEGQTSWEAPGLNPDVSLKDIFGGAYIQASIGFYLK